MVRPLKQMCVFHFKARYTVHVLQSQYRRYSITYTSETRDTRIKMPAYYLPNQSTAKVVQEAGLLFLYLLNLDQKIMNNVPW